jgi:hypothetical protein
MSKASPTSLWRTAFEGVFALLPFLIGMRLGRRAEVVASTKGGTEVRGLPLAVIGARQQARAARSG